MNDGAAPYLLLLPFPCRAELESKEKGQRRRRKSGNASNNFVPEDNTSVLANATHSHTHTIPNKSLQWRVV
jgi:hypothetical protein